MASGVASLTLGSPVAAGQKKKKKKCKKGLTKCHNACANLQTDRRNCGRCGKRCRDFEGKCEGGVCIANACLAGAHYCDPEVRVGCGRNCACASQVGGVAICSDCGVCVTPECQSNDDCLAAGLPEGTICGDGAGGRCNECTKACFTPCGSCTNCDCVK